ncbi:MAG: DUF6062 family protein [Clostridiales bacterium]|jgi:hypothetical protein|nr:DUF6062 family protein [Clostridiales bacterium]
MKESIYTIPINEVFGRLDGCPMCSLERGLESASLEYVMGAAMMEPDVRVKTNEQGFCAAHLGKMLAMNNRLSLSLLLESRLMEVEKALFARGGKMAPVECDAKKLKEATARATSSCFVCARIEGFMAHCNENAIFMWNTESEFRARLEAQPFFCIRHCDMLLGRAIKLLRKKELAGFAGAMARLCGAYAGALREDVSAFCKSFDYRNAGAEISAAASSSAERAAAFLAPST